MRTFHFTSAILNNKKRQENFLPLFCLMSEENFSSFVSDGLHSAGGLPLHKEVIRRNHTSKVLKGLLLTSVLM